jgi:hypothetical protein
MLTPKSTRNGQPVAPFPGIVQNLAYDGAVASSAFAAGTQVLRLCATTDCYILIAAAPVASSTTGILLSSGHVEFFHLLSAGLKVSAIKVVDAGILSIGQIA